VKSLSFAYQRSEPEKDKWKDSWDATDDEQLPAVVRLTVEPETPDEPALDYEVPVYVGVLNAITGEDDFKGRRARGPRVSFSKDAALNKKGQKATGKDKQPTPEPDDGGDGVDE